MESTSIFAQMTSYGIITSDVICILMFNTYDPFPVNSQCLKTCGVDSPDNSNFVYDKERNEGA